MITNSASKDVLNNFSALTIIVVIPILTFSIYPRPNRYRIHVDRSAASFRLFLATLSGIAGTTVQKRVYAVTPHS
jgi:FMN-dependent NADH-azoreductase